MLKCQDIASQSSDFVDKHLNLKDRFGFYLHLLICGHCRHYIQQFKAMILNSRTLSKKSASDTTAENILKHCKQHQDNQH